MAVLGYGYEQWGGRWLPTLHKSTKRDYYVSGVLTLKLLMELVPVVRFLDVFDLVEKSAKSKISQPPPLPPTSSSPTATAVGLESPDDPVDELVLSIQVSRAAIFPG